MSESQNLWHSAGPASDEDDALSGGWSEYLVQRFDDLSVVSPNSILIPIIVDDSRSDLFIGHVRTFNGVFEYFKVEDVYCPGTGEVRKPCDESDSLSRKRAFQRFWSLLRSASHSVSASQSITLGALKWEVRYIISKTHLNGNMGESQGYALSELTSLPDFFHQHHPPIEFQVALTGVLSRELCIESNPLFLK